MMAAKSGVGSLKKKQRTTRIRPTSHDPDPTPPPPADSRRSVHPHRRRYLAGDDYDDDCDQEDLKLVLKLPLTSRYAAASGRSSPSSDGEEEEDTAKPPKKRRISGSPVRRTTRPFSGTPLPERASLVDVLNNLQKKDTYSVFARPVEPDELPDYHDVIEHPMDFGTVRRKLAGSMYRSFEQFEDDVFLICSNAMQYNAPDTIYFRQASSIHDMARKRFQELRADHISSGVSSKIEDTTSLYTVEKRTLKNPQCRNASEPLRSDISSMKKMIKKSHCRTALHHHGSDFSSMEKKMLKEHQYRASPKPLSSDVSSLDKKTLKDVNGRIASSPLGSDISSMKTNTLREPYRKAAHEMPVSSITSLKKKMLKKTQPRISPQSLDSDMNLREPHRETAHEPNVSNTTSLEKKMLKKPQSRAVPRLLDSDIYLENKTSKQAHCRTVKEPLDSDISYLEKKASKTALCRPETYVSNITSLENKTLKKPQSKVVPQLFGSDISSEIKTSKRAHCRTVVETLDSDISYLEKKSSVKEPLDSDTSYLEKNASKTAPCRPETHVSNITSLENRTLKKPQSRVVPQLFDSDISSEIKISKRAQCRMVVETPDSDISYLEQKSLMMAPSRTAPELHISNVTSLEKKTEKKTLKKPHSRIVPQLFDSNISSEIKTSKKRQCRTVIETLDSDVSSLEKKESKTAPCRTAPEPHVSNITSLENKMLKEPQARIVPQLFDSDISSESKTSKKAECRMATEPLASDISSLEKKSSKTSPCRTVPEPLGSDASSGATACGADTCTDMSTLQAQGLVSCSDLSKAQGDGLPSATEAQTGLSSEQVATVERSDTINGSVNGSSSLGESISEKADEVPAKDSPSKLDHEPFMVDVNRRETYIMSDQVPMVDPDSLFDVFEGEPRQLVSVGLQSEYSYARSLARFAASLGPIAQEIVSKKIEQALPPGVNFGPGWVGEYDPPPPPVIYVRNTTQQQQPQEVLKHKTVVSKDNRNVTEVFRKDKRNVTKSDTAHNGNDKDMFFCLQSQATTEKPLNRTSTCMEGATRLRTHNQKHGPIAIDLAHNPSFNSSVSHHQKRQAAGRFSNAYTNEPSVHRPQSSSEASSFKFPSMIPMERNQVQAETRQQLHVGADVSGSSTWRTPASSVPNTSFRTSNQQSVVQRWSGRGSQDQATNDPSSLMNSSDKNYSQSNISRACNNTVHSPRQENPNAAWISFGAPAEWKSIDGGRIRNNQVGSASFNPAWRIPSPASRFDEDSRMKQEVQNKGLVIFPQLMTTDLSRLRSPWQDLVQHNKPKDQLPPDLNISFQPPESPARTSSGIHVDSQHPDLALQL